MNKYIFRIKAIGKVMPISCTRGLQKVTFIQSLIIAFIILTLFKS